MKRREFLKSSMATAALLGFGDYGLLNPRIGLAASTTEDFNRVLTIPPLLEGSPRQDDTLYSFRADEARESFLPDVSTRTMGYNGSYLGPTIRVRDGDKVAFQIENKLEEVTTVHWHGLHVPAEWDGGPHQVIMPGEIWRPHFAIDQQAATLWYHPHAIGRTGEHVYQGLAGLFYIDDEVSESLPIPKQYGIDDIPLVIQDRRFYDNGDFAYARSMHDVMHGVMGNFLLVNGTLSPHFTVQRGITRLRLLNGSNSSIYRFRLSKNTPMHVIASDGGFLNRPVAVTEIILSAGERAEVLIDLSQGAAGDRIRLYADQFGGSTFDALELRVGNKQAQWSSIPKTLREQVRLHPDQADNTRYFAMETFSSRGRGMGMMGGNRLSINGKKMDMNRIDERIPLGSTEIWELENISAGMMQVPHSMHLHDVQFNILDRNGQPPSEVESGRKDTVLLWPNDKVRIIARFEDYTGLYMYHCHILEHEDDGMMGQFEVYDDETAAGDTS